MTRPTFPEHWQELMAGYALGDLSAQEVEELQQLLSAHPELQAELNRLQETVAMLPYALPEQEPPTHLRDTILNAAQLEIPIDRPIAAVPRRRKIPWAALGSAAAAALLVVLGADNYALRQRVQTLTADTRRLQQQLQDNQAIVAALQQPGLQVYNLEGTGQAKGSSGSLIVNPNQQVLLTAQNLPTLPVGRAYRLWAVPVGAKTPTYCGQFNSTQSITAWSAPDATCSNGRVQMLITDESTSDPPIPKGTLVMKSRA